MAYPIWLTKLSPEFFLVRRIAFEKKIHKILKYFAIQEIYAI